MQTFILLKMNRSIADPAASAIFPLLFVQAWPNLNQFERPIRPVFLLIVFGYRNKADSTVYSEGIVY